MNKSFRFFQMLALATVGSLAIACTSTSGGGGTTADTTTAADTGTGTGSDAAAGTDTAKADGTAAADTSTDAAKAGDTATTGGDVATTGGDAATAADTGSTGTKKGCTSADDQAFLKALEADKAKSDKFGDDVKNCTLANVGKPDEASAVAAIGKCLVDDKKQGVSLDCGGCYGIRGYCTFVNCVKNTEEAKTANCVMAPTGDTCTACANKYNCITKAEDCKVGK